VCITRGLQPPRLFIYLITYLFMWRTLQVDVVSLSRRMRRRRRRRWRVVCRAVVRWCPHMHMFYSIVPLFGGVCESVYVFKSRLG